MSVGEDQAVQPRAAAVPTSGIADPAPLGLAAFALTTFLFSAKNANWMTHAGGLTFLGYAFAYGGLCQLLAGMWEFRNRNVFGSTAFSSYGGFWIGAGLWIELAGVHDTAAQFNHDVAWINLAFLVFNTYMLIMSTQVNAAVFGVFFTLELTLLFLAIGFFSAGAAPTTGLIQFAGYLGLITAVVAWYTSAAGVANGIGGRIRLPVGRPFIV
ncbi:MAG: acetate uptake transporter [Streptosporangiaceae bacterium]|nr:acetate uptake transporter [Streptosporangiaceae bacterium]